MTDEEFRAIIAAGPAVVMVESRHMIALLDERDGLRGEVKRLLNHHKKIWTESYHAIIAAPGVKP